MTPAVQLGSAHLPRAQVQVLTVLGPGYSLPKQPFHLDTLTGGGAEGTKPSHLRRGELLRLSNNKYSQPLSSGWLEDTRGYSLPTPQCHIYCCHCRGYIRMWTNSSLHLGMSKDTGAGAVQPVALRKAFPAERSPFLGMGLGMGRHIAWHLLLQCLPPCNWQLLKAFLLRIQMRNLRSLGICQLYKVARS